MGIVVGVISATGGCLFSGRSVKLEAAAEAKANGTGVPVKASASLINCTSQSRQLNNERAEVCPVMSIFFLELVLGLFCLLDFTVLTNMWLSHVTGHGICNQDD